LIAAQIQGIMKHVVCAIPIAILVSQVPGLSFLVIKALALHELVRTMAEIPTRSPDPRFLNIVYDLLQLSPVGDKIFDIISMSQATIIDTMRLELHP
jgi:hypothetical protein